MNIRKISWILSAIAVLLFLPFTGAWSKKKESKHKKPSYSVKLPPSPFISEVFEMTIPEWVSKQIQTDFAYFNGKEISLQEIHDFFDQSPTSWYMAKFSIINNKLTVEKRFSDCFVNVRLNVYTEVVKRMCQNIKMPDCVFLISLADAFSAPINVIENVPVLALAKPHQQEGVILIPDFEVFLSGAKLLKQVETSIHESPWETKKEQAVWRGATTGGTEFNTETFLNIPRAAAVAASLKYPKWVDARFTQVVHCTEPDKVLKKFRSFFSSSMSIAEQIKYRYQLLIDGNSCAYSRAYWQLFSNCLTLKQESTHIQWYYGCLRPYEHYIPLKANLSDLIEKLKWAQAHEEESRAVMEQARYFALNNLQLHHVYQYLFLVLMEYSRLKVVEK